MTTPWFTTTDDARELKQGGNARAGSTCGVESEANLLGVVFTETGIMTGRPSAWSTPTHWAFEGTGLQDGDLFGQASLHMRCPGGASGHETDKVSASSPPDVNNVAKGTNIDDGGAELTCYETASGGAVFSAGSIAWPSARSWSMKGSRRSRPMCWRRFLEAVSS